MADLRGAPLPVQRADRRVEVERGLFDVGQRLDVARADVDALRRGTRNRRDKRRCWPATMLPGSAKPSAAWAIASRGFDGPSTGMMMYTPSGKPQRANVMPRSLV